MISFNDINEARSFLLDQKRIDDKPIFFRGENSNYEIIKPSIDRGYNSILFDERIYLSNFVKHLHDYISDQLIKSQNLKAYNLFKNVYSSYDIFDNGQSSNYLHLSNSIIALLQHYGWKTNFIDLTTDIDVALFFASMDIQNNKVLNDEFGYIYYFDLYQSYPESYTYNLEKITNGFSELYNIQYTRALKQKGYGMQIQTENELEFINSIKQTLRFKRSNDMKLIYNLNDLFPRDNLYLLLKSLELNYLFDYMNQEIEFTHHYTKRIINKLENFNLSKIEWISRE